MQQDSRTQKYCIAQLLENPRVTEWDSSSWPLHVTLADTFFVDWEQNKTLDQLSDLCKISTSFTVSTAEDILLGADRNIPARKLLDTVELVKLHTDIIAILTNSGAVFNNPEYTNAGFLPHITHQPDKNIPEDVLVAFDTLYIIDMFPDSNPDKRRLLHALSFSD